MITQESKEKLLKYLTGNYTENTLPNNPYFRNNKTNLTNLRQYFQTNFPNGYFIFGFIQGKDIYGNGLTDYVIYGTFDTGGSNFRTYIVIVNSNFIPQALLFRYKSGRYFEIWSKLFVNDDGTFIAISNENNKVKMTLLNNFLIKRKDDYEVITRISYFLPNFSTDNSVVGLKQNNDRYCLISIKGANKIVIADVTIYVGSPITLTQYEHTVPEGAGEAGSIKLMDFNAVWNNTQDLNVFCIFSCITTHIRFTFSLTFKNGTFTQQTIPFPAGTALSSAVIITRNNIYFSVDYYVSARNSNLKIYRYLNNTLNEIYSIDTLQPTALNYRSNIGLYRIQNEIFAVILDLTNLNSNKYRLSFAKIINNNVYINQHSQITILEEDTGDFFVSKQFNLYNYYFLDANYSYTTQQIYNQINYNGLPRTKLDSLTSQSSELYDISDNIIFARNLYNKMVIRNKSVSTIQVPPIFLNDIEIEKEHLISKSNNIIINNQQTINKNIFEELLINFINKLNVINQNFEPYTSNVDGAIKINLSVSRDNDYKNAKIGKYRINYKNGTNETNIIDFSQITYETATLAKYVFNVYNSFEKPIKNIQLISNDELTVYLTIDFATQDTNKLYLITQKVEVI